MKTISIHDAKTNLSKYIAAAKKGEKIYIGSFGKAEVVLTTLSKQDSPGQLRDFSLAKNKIQAKSDAFTDDTDLAIAHLMMGIDNTAL